MFCSKCGNQLPDGIAFCPSCGNQINSQPVAPTPVEPAAPFIEPVVPTIEPVVPTIEPTAPIVEPTAPIVEPTAPVMQQPMMQQPMMQQPVMPTMPQGTQPKKSKAPLIIGIVAATLVIAIIAIIIILLAGGDDEKPASGKEQETTTANNEATTEVPTEEPTEEPTTNKPVVVKPDVDDALDVVEDFLSYSDSGKYSKILKLFYPAAVEYLVNEYNVSDEDVAEEYASYFMNSDNAVFSYELDDVEEEDGAIFEDSYEDDYVGLDSYIEPEAFALVSVLFDVYDTDAYGYFYLAFADGQWLVCDVDTSEINDAIESANNTSGGDGTVTHFTLDAVNSALAMNSVELLGGCFGDTVDLGEVSIIAPDSWAVNDAVDDEGVLFEIYSPEDVVYFDIMDYTNDYASFNSIEEYLLDWANYALDEGMTEVALGRIDGLYEDGYAMTYATSDGSSYVMTFFESNGTLYTLTVGGDYDSDYFEEGLNAVGTFDIK
ncbi:MAG: zinc-ribbon domain-containing protein [Lachnospiraceae bacterium]|nr:zinc-ribbon domain-containing protein [Lachnospiraceae bacterium]